MTTPKESGWRERLEQMQNGDVVICDGLYTGKIGHIVGIGSTEHSIKLLIDNEIERYEPDYALITIPDDNKKALALLVSHLATAIAATEARVREEAWDEIVEFNNLLCRGARMPSELQVLLAQKIARMKALFSSKTPNHD